LQRVLSTVTLLGLLVATAAAFAITERLKLVKSPVYGTVVSKRLSPVCDCASDKATIRVKLRRGDDLTVSILDQHRAVVRTLVQGAFTPRGVATFTWNGSNDLGSRAPDGVYHPEIHLAQQHRTILLPNRIVLDTHAPKVREATLSRSTISPDGDHVRDSVTIRYRLDTPAHVLVYLGSKLLIRSRVHTAEGKVLWYGTVDGTPLKPGTYTLSVGAVDLAGNVTPAKARRALVVRVRYIQLARNRIVVRKPGVRFGVGVATDARTYRWTLDGRHGVSSDRVLRLTAPKRPGTYTLAVGERTYTAHATLVVRSGR
jgi:FlgD Ig-like domain